MTGRGIVLGFQPKVLNPFHFKTALVPSAMAELWSGSISIAGTNAIDWPQ